MAARLYSTEYVLTASSTQVPLTGINSNEALSVTSATVCNPDTGSRVLTMNLSSTGAAASAVNLIESKRPMSINSAPTNTALSGKVIMPGAKLYANTDAFATTACVLSISGTVIPQAQ